MQYKKFVLLIFFLVSAAFYPYASITYTLTNMDIAVTRDTDGTARFQSAHSYLNMPGKPALPCYISAFLLTHNADLSTVPVSIKSRWRKQLPVAFSVAREQIQLL